jgi:Uma2 family endonuclease
MSTATPRLITAEEFARMPNPPDGSKQELVRGEIVTMPPPGFRHGTTQVNAAFMLKTYAKTVRPGHVTVESGVITETGPDTVRGPDVSYWSYERMPKDDAPVVYANIAPDVVVEVRSPSNTDEKITKKVREYFAGGARLVWIADPEDRTVTVYRQPGDGRVLWDDATLTGEDVLPEFSCKVSELFD